MKTIDKKLVGISFAITAILFIFTIALFDITYALNDDVMINSLISGAFTGTPEFMTFYFSVPLSFIISSLYKIIPVLPWLGIFFVTIIFTCFYLITYRFLKIINAATNKHILSILYTCSVAFLIYFLLFINNTVLLHYTIIAALVGGTGLLLLITSDFYDSFKKMISHNFLAIVLMLFCYLIRENVFFMLMPFFAVAGIYKLVYFGKKSFKNYCLLLVSFIMIMLLAFAINKLPYNSTNWQEYLKYNDARTKLYDYVLIHNDDSAIAFYNENGIDNETYDLYRSYNIMLDEKNIDLLNKLSSYENELHAGRSTFTHLKEVFYVYRHSCLNKEYMPVIIVILAFYLITFISFIDKKQKKQLFTLLLLFAARSFMWSYLIWNDRYPERVTYSLMYIELFVLIGIFIDLAKLSKKLILTNFIPMLTMLSLLYGAAYTMQDFSKDYNEVIQSNANDNILFDYINANPDNIYFLDVFTAVNHTDTAIKNQPSVRPCNYMILGGWMVESPLTTKRINVLGYDTVKDALLNGDNTYIVLKDNMYNGITIKNYEAWLNADFKLEKSLYNDIDEFLIYKIVK